MRSTLRLWQALLFVLAATFLVVVIVRTAWLSDDAYITLRTIDNWRQGFGLRWNVAERVQAYTHPLWLFAVAAAWGITGEPYFSTIVLSVVCASAAAMLLAASSGRWFPGVATFLLLAAAQSFVDYATSGLETPLTFLLLAGFSVAYWSRRSAEARALSCSLLAALLAVNRLDSIVLVLPPLVHLALSGGRRAAARLAAGFLPLVIWEAFSVVYYGVPVPNTAYAKLAHGIPQHELTAQGLAYLANSWRDDPVTLLTIAGALVFACWRPAFESATAAAAVALHLGYVVRIGGDFMSGRFLAPAFIMSVSILLKHSSTERIRVGMAASMSLLAATQMPAAVARAWPARPPLPVDALVDATGIADERRIYARDTGFLEAVHRRAAPHPAWELAGRRMSELGVSVMTRDSVGMFGYGAGPTVHLVDRLGLGDPLMARMPATRPWRIGHFYRELPGGYIGLLRGQTDRLADPQLNEYYAAIRLMTRGPLWSIERWRAMLMLNRHPTAPGPSYAANSTGMRLGMSPLSNASLIRRSTAFRPRSP